MPERLIVLDSHIWFWWINLENSRFPDFLIPWIENADQVGVSSVSCFELALAVQKGRLSLPVSPGEWFEYALAKSGIRLLSLSPQIAMRAVELHPVHRDPFDRIIIATALEWNARLASLDGKFKNYPELSEILLHKDERRR